MALIKETIVANDSLKELSDEQINAIVTLSANDEEATIGRRIGEIYREMDTTIKEATGVERDGAEKTYVYLKRATSEFADKFKDYDTLKSDIETLRAEKTALEEQIANGGDEALKGQLLTAKKELETTKNQFNELKTNYDRAKVEHEKAISNIRIDAEIEKAKEGVAFKKGMNEAALGALISRAVANVRAKNPSFEDRGGEKRLIFHDENGSPLNNAENKLNPFTAKELLMKEFEVLDILEKRPGAGAGGSKVNPDRKDILGASTQTEATDIINKMLAENGIPKTSPKFQTEFNKIWTESNISSLPLK